MSINKFIAFTDFMWFYNQYKPLTPYGQDQKEKYLLHTDIKVLNDIFDNTQNLINFISEDNISVLKIEHHFDRIDRMNSLYKEQFDAADLFLIKKFLIHYKSIFKLIPDKIKQKLDINFYSDELLNILSPDNDLNETFYLSSSFSDELKLIRKQISHVYGQLSEIKNKVIDFIFENNKIDFRNREFVLVEKSTLNILETKKIYYEYYDSKMLLLKPIFPTEYMDLLDKKEELLNEENEQEKYILQLLSKAVLEQQHNLLLYIKAVEQLDTFIARAQLAINLSLTRPNADCGLTFNVVEGIFLPLKSKNTKLGMNYMPLTAEFNSNAILLSGSNMGGKTVVFKTIGFLQLLTQFGFFVPAKKLETRIYSEFVALGISEQSNIEGLSSFGQEINELINALKEPSKSTLLLADELAKTTNATEAKAILYGLLQIIVENYNITGFFATHFINLPQIDGVLKCKMKGLNQEAYQTYHKSNDTDSIQEKIKLINSFMQYEVVNDCGISSDFDALIIAQMLGLNPEIIKHANNYLAKMV